MVKRDLSFRKKGFFILVLVMFSLAYNMKLDNSITGDVIQGFQGSFSQEEYCECPVDTPMDDCGYDVCSNKYCLELVPPKFDRSGEIEKGETAKIVAHKCTSESKNNPLKDCACPEKYVNIVESGVEGGTLSITFACKKEKAIYCSLNNDCIGTTIITDAEGNVISENSKSYGNCVEK